MAESHDDHHPPNNNNNNNIPVFTVIKNNSILKNIFLLRPSPQMSNLDEKEEILTAGRHPNCSIVLTHPSISRFHLHIRSNPYSRKLSVTDLSSVHGTWVCGKRMRPRECVEMKEGDEMRLGGSSRVYKLHWVSACQAYDLENPFCPSSDVVMCDVIDNHEDEEELMFQDETGEVAEGDVSLNWEAETSREEIPLQEPVRNDTVLKGILKCNKESLPGALSFPLPDVETMKEAQVGEINVESENESLFSEIASGRGIEYSQMVECDEGVPLERNLSEEHVQMKQFRPSPETCKTDSKVKAEDCSQLLEVCINVQGLLASQECPSAICEKLPLLAEDTKGIARISNEESSLIETEKGINQYVTASQTPKLDSTVGELFTTGTGEGFDVMCMGYCENSDVENEAPKLNLTGELYASENGEGFDAMLLGTCEYSDVENEAQKLDLTEELHATENGEGFDAMVMATCEYSDVEYEAPKLDLTEELHAKVNGEGSDVMLMDTCEYSDVGYEAINVTPINSDPSIYPESSDETQNCKSERVFTEFVFDQGSIHQESDVKPEDTVQLLSRTESRSLQLIVNSAVRLGPREDSLAIERENDALVPDSGTLILEPLLDSFLFSENDTKESCGYTSMKSESECQSPVTPFGAKGILDKGNEKGSKTMSNQGSNISKASSQRCQPLGALKILSCSSKVKTRGSTTSARTQQRKSNSDNKSVSKTLFDHEGDENEISSPDKEKCRYSARPLKCMKKMGLFDETVEYEAEVYTPDKENFTPNSRLLKSMKKMGLFDENKMNSSVSEKASSMTISNSPFLTGQKYRTDSMAENETWNKKIYVSVPRKMERVPLQSLSINSSCRSHPDTSVNKVATRSPDSVTSAHSRTKISPIKNKIEMEAKVNWCMVADITCFLDSKSRKALTLLQGLRGTKLIVPETVPRELEAMKQQASFFRRTTDVSAALKWLEDCLVNTKWWIHIQSSIEETRHQLPTPPSPKQIDGTHHNRKKSWKIFSLFQSRSEVSSPKTEYHIIECALQEMRSIHDNHRIAILSNDTSLRTIAKAQGLICETAMEFRHSLVNPFSERFLWPESSPRGRTWSCHDDIVLKEYFYSDQSSSLSKGHVSLKGLQLILAYGRRDHACIGISYKKTIEFGLLETE